MLHPADVSCDALGAVGEEKAERRHRGNEDRASRCLREGEAVGRDVKGARSKEGRDAEAEHEACGKYGPSAVPLDCAADGVEPRRAEPAGEQGPRQHLAPVAPHGQVYDPVGDHVAQPEEAPVRQHARGEERQVLGNGKAEPAAHEEQEEAGERPLPGQDAPDTDAPGAEQAIDGDRCGSRADTSRDCRHAHEAGLSSTRRSPRPRPQRSVTTGPGDVATGLPLQRTANPPG